MSPHKFLTLPVLIMGACDPNCAVVGVLHPVSYPDLQIGTFTFTALFSVFSFFFAAA